MEHLLTLEAFRAEVGVPDEDIDLARAGLLIARVQDPAVDLDHVLARLNTLAARVLERVSLEDEPLTQVLALIDVVIRRQGLQGAQEDYYDPRNSFLHEVLERKVGIPISLSVLLMSVGARAGIPLGGTSLPLHFMVRVVGAQPPLFVDCYDGGRIFSAEDCRQIVRAMSQGRFDFYPQMLEVISNAAVLTRMLNNLKLIYLNDERLDRALPMLDCLLELNPREPQLLRERGLVHWRLGHPVDARADLNEYLQVSDQPPDAAEIRGLIQSLE